MGGARGGVALRLLSSRRVAPVPSGDVPDRRFVPRNTPSRVGARTVSRAQKGAHEFRRLFGADEVRDALFFEPLERSPPRRTAERGMRPFRGIAAPARAAPDLIETGDGERDPVDPWLGPRWHQFAGDSANFLFRLYY